MIVTYALISNAVEKVKSFDFNSDGHFLWHLIGVIFFF